MGCLSFLTPSNYLASYRIHCDVYQILPEKKDERKTNNQFFQGQKGCKVEKLVTSLKKDKGTLKENRKGKSISYNIFNGP